MSSSHTSLAVPPNALDHMQGRKDARVTVLEYGDFECPSCKVAATTPTLLMEQFPDTVRFIFRHYPLIEAHPHAMRAAEAAEAAAAQGKFWEMYHLLFDDQAHLEEADLKRYMQSLGLDLTRYQKEMDENLHVQRLREQMEGGQRSHVRATPTFFVNGLLQDISFGMRSLHDAVAAVVAHQG